MTEDVRRRIHQLALESQFSTMDEMLARCRHCAEIFASGGEKEKLEDGTGPMESPAA
jgi:hypothetical protein